MGFYDEMQAVAKDVLSEFKQGTVSYIELTPGTGPADNPGAPQENPIVIDATVRDVEFKYVDGTNIETTDKQVIFAPVDGLVVDDLDYLLLDGTRHRVIQVFNVPAVGTVVVHKVVVRR